MTKERAIDLCQSIDKYLCAGNPIWDVKQIHDAMSMAIEALKAQPKFTRITIDTDERWLNRKLDVFKDRLYLNEKTMIIYVPFVSFEAVVQSGGTIKRIGEEE